MAQRFVLGERAGFTLRPTELVHEAWLRLARRSGLGDEERAGFLRSASTAMRRILVDHARARTAERRDASRNVPLADDLSDANDLERLAGIADLDSALEELSRVDPGLSRVVELRFFGGLTVEEAADAAGVSPRTIKREWRLARAWLRRRVGEVSDG